MLYQLSYASPSSDFTLPAQPPTHPETAPGAKERTGTLPLRAYHGTVSKVSTQMRPPQTKPSHPRSHFSATIWLDMTRLPREPAKAVHSPQGSPMKVQRVLPACAAGLAILAAVLAVPAHPQAAPPRR